MIHYEFYLKAFLYRSLFGNLKSQPKESEKETGVATVALFSADEFAIVGDQTNSSSCSFLFSF